MWQSIVNTFKVLCCIHVCENVYLCIDSFELFLIYVKKYGSAQRPPPHDIEELYSRMYYTFIALHGHLKRE
jgi:hypothetical protein